ncbi:MAG TPA: DUF2255 family protein, partial [Candidatus Caenarcaniphilales bacterium]|nr:DUF2255 family protein [Candidatus Caenarcaniphilales bacterium]
MNPPHFDPKVVRLLEREPEVRVETRGADDAVHRTIIWVVVDDGEVFVRSWRGEGAQWFRAALDRPTEVALLATGQRIPVLPVLATDAASIARCSRAL